MRVWTAAPLGKYSMVRYALCCAASVLLVACGGSGNSGKQAQTFASLALFDPVNATSPITPFPFDGLFSGASTPTLNIPFPPGSAPLTDMNQVDGFSTTSPIFADVAGQLDYSTVPANIVIVNSSTGQVLVPGVDFTVENEIATATDPLSGALTPISSQRSRLYISPLKPLAPSTRYLVALLNGMRTVDGGGVIASDAFNITASATPVSEQSDPQLAQYNATQLAELEALRSQLIHPVVQALSAQIPASSMVLAWSFTTESISDALTLVAQNAGAGLIAVANTTQTTAVAGGFGMADIYAGITTVPYYLQVPSAANPAAPLSGFWHADPAKPNNAASFLGQIPCGAFAAGATVNGVTLQPSASTTACFPSLDASTASTQTVPVLVTVPNANSGQTEPAGGWPVVIFQHGITQDRENVLAVADGLARAGFVAVAMDLPLHGVTNTADPFYRNQLFAGTPAAALITGERTFDLDLENNASGAAGPDGVIDGSGTWFINLQSFITSRDNLREAVADLIVLGKSVKGLDLNGDGTPDVNPNRIYYFGHSLGGIVGGTLLAVDSDIRAAVLANPGGGVAKLLDASASFGPPIAAGLAAQGQAQGTDNFPSAPLYESFLKFAQTLVDSGDPINYAAAASVAHAIDMIEVIGDQVVPNTALSTCPVPLPVGVDSTATLITACAGSASQDVTVEPGYLSGTDPLIAAQGLSVVGPVTPPLATPDVITGAKLDYVVQFAQGEHGTVLSPAGPNGATQFLAVTEEMQSEAAQFLASDGQCLAVGGSCP